MSTSTQQNQFTKAPLQGKHYLLGIVFLFLISFVLTPLSCYPLTLSVLVFGRVKGHLMGLFCLLGMLMLALSPYSQESGGAILVCYLFSLIISFCLSESLLRRKRPQDILLKSVPLAFCLISVLLLGYFTYLKNDIVPRIQATTEQIAHRIDEKKKALATGTTLSDRDLVAFLQTPEHFMDKNHTDSANLPFKERLLSGIPMLVWYILFALMRGAYSLEQFAGLLSGPTALTKEILEVLPMIPGHLFLGVLFAGWACLYLILKGIRTYRLIPGYSYTERDLTEFRMPEELIWLPIILLGLVVTGTTYLGPIGMAVAENLLRAIGIFYFFQGLGIYFAFLDTVRIRGPLRIFLVGLTLLTGYWFMIFIGLFDLWVNFRKFLKVKMK